MKYKEEDYIESGIYSDDEEIEHYRAKVVKCSKPHKCVSCQSEIIKGDDALMEAGFLDGKPVSCHTCLSCIDRWLDEINGEDEMSDEYIRTGY